MTNMAFSAKQSLPQTFRLRRQLSESIIFSKNCSSYISSGLPTANSFPQKKPHQTPSPPPPNPPNPQSSMADWALRLPRPPWAPWRGAPKPRWATSWSRTWCTSAGPWRSWSRWRWPEDQPIVLGFLGLVRLRKCQFMWLVMVSKCQLIFFTLW